MPHNETGPNILSRLSAEHRVAVAARVIALWMMTDIGIYIRENGLRLSSENSPNASAKGVMLEAAGSEFRQIRVSCLEVKPDSNAHIARQQMGFTSKTIVSKLGNKRVHTWPEFQAATYYLEDHDVAAKIDSSLSIAPILEDDGAEFRKHYASKAIEQVEILGESVDLRQLVSNTTQDTEYWLRH